MMLTRGFSPAGRFERLALRHLRRPYSVHSQYIARLAHCHWSSSMVRGRKRWIVVPSGVTPPPIISAIEPVTTTAGRSGSSTAWRASSRLRCPRGRAVLRPGR
jgi:hypothetical protein